MKKFKIDLTPKPMGPVRDLIGGTFGWFIFYLIAIQLLRIPLWLAGYPTS